MGRSLAQGEQQCGLDEPLDPGGDFPLVRGDESSIPGPWSAPSTPVMVVWSWRHVSNIYVNNIYVKHQYEKLGVRSRVALIASRYDVSTTPGLRRPGSKCEVGSWALHKPQRPPAASLGSYRE